MVGWRLLEIRRGTNMYLKAPKKVTGTFVIEFRGTSDRVWEME